MKNIIKYEFLKILTNKLFQYTCAIFILINICILVYSSYTLKPNEVPYFAYQLLNTKLKHLTEEEKKEFIQTEYEKYNAFDLINKIDNWKKSENEEMREYANTLKEENITIYEKYREEYQDATYPFTKDVDTEIQFWEEIKKELDKSQQYQSIIKGILKKAEDLQTISIFKENKDAFSSKNMIDIAKSYEKMLDTKINYQPSKGVSIFTKFGITDILMILFMFVISSIIIFEEREKNLFSLIKSTKNGRTKTIVAKIIVMEMSIIGFSILMYGINLIYVGITIGYGDLGASLQSLPTFIYSTIKVTIGEYLVLFLCTKMMMLFMLSLVIVLISIFAKNNVTTYITFLGVLLVSTLLYYTVDPISNYHILKYINLFQFLEVNGMYDTYFNIKLGNSMQNVLTLSNISVVIVLISTILAIINIFNQKRDLQIRESKVINRLKQFHIFQYRISNKVITQEKYKLFTMNKITVFILVFLVFQLYQFQVTNKTISFSEKVYKSYMEMLNGKLTEEKEELIATEIEKFRQAEITITNIDNKVKQGEIDKRIATSYKEPYEEILSTKSIFDRVLTQYQYIKENPKAEFVYDTGYKELLRVYQYAFLDSDISLMLISIICFTSIFVLEYRTGMICLLNTTPKGRKNTAKAKILVCMVAGIILFVITVIPEFAKILEKYGLHNLGAPITSLMYFKNLPSDMSILVFIILMYALRLLCFLCIILWILWISLKLKNITYSILVASMILLVPIVFLFLGYENAIFFSMIPVLNVSKVIMLGNYMGWLYIFVPVIIGIFCARDMCKKFK